MSISQYYYLSYRDDHSCGFINVQGYKVLDYVVLQNVIEMRVLHNIYSKK